MSFYTSLTGLNAATAQLGVTSNNIANVGTTGFKRSRADFGDIFATSPLQKASSTIGQGVSLKQVSQEFSQGNISFSSNALDLAVSGDGFFPLKSADGLQDVYTRNGAFLLNDQFNVVNSAGQRLMAATVDSTGSANVNERVVLTIPQQTTGEAKETSQISLGVNFPADATVITASFNRSNPATYNKSTALTVYDKGGNGYLATVYYTKTQNASQTSPFNKWQTHVFIGNDEVKASLQQATDSNKEALYVNKYGQTKPFSEVKDFLVNGKTQKFELNDLTDKRTSMAATIDGVSAASGYDLTAGFDFKTYAAASAANKASLKDIFSVNIDGTTAPVSVDLSALAARTGKVNGTDVAAEITNQLNHKYGDERFWDFSATTSQTFSLSRSDGANVTTQDITLSGITDNVSTTSAAGVTTVSTNLAKVTTEQALSEIRKQLPATISVSYDEVSQGFKFIDSASATLSVQGGTATAPAANSVLGLGPTAVTLNDEGGYEGKVAPNSDTFVRPEAQQRFGIKVSFDTVNKTFSLSSGSTGDKSTIAVTGATTLANEMLGISNAEVKVSSEAVRGIASQPAMVLGTAIPVNVKNNFAVDATNNSFVVTVDEVKSTITVPVRSDYSLDTFMAALQKRINLMADASGNTVNGVKVGYDAANNRFTFTGGTTSSNSFLKVSGSPTWGLDKAEVGNGQTSTWIKPTQYLDESLSTPSPLYIDASGKETTNQDGFTALPEWSPIYLAKGELTFDTSGVIVSPAAGSALDTVFLADGKGALTININYSKSTQFTSPFAVLSQSQDGAPEGDLVGVSIGVDGLVNASYSNGSQKSLAKILLVNFSSPKGLRQIGDSNFVASAESGNPTLGTAGGAGFGTIRAGATEGSNVDLTKELVDLITAQRNFQANAKAIETSTTMTQAIINIRG
jgi:flagellar hook-basal body protein